VNDRSKVAKEGKCGASSIGSGPYYLENRSMPGGSAEEKSPQPR
jgi:hypothetical protein